MARKKKFEEDVIPSVESVMAMDSSPEINHLLLALEKPQFEEIILNGRKEIIVLKKSIVIHDKEYVQVTTREGVTYLL